MDEPKIEPASQTTKNTPVVKKGSGIWELVGILIVMLLMFIICFFPLFLQKLTTPSPDEKFVAQLKELPPDTQSLIAEIIEVNNHSRQILERLQKDADETERLVQQKKEALDELQKQNEMLKLTPEQLEIIERYNRVVNKEPASFKDWLFQKSVWYDKLLGIILSIVGFIAGRWYQSKK